MHSQNVCYDTLCNRRTKKIKGVFYLFPRRYWFVLFTYIVMQLSIFVFAPLIHIMFGVDKITASIYWNIISFIIGTIIVLSLLRKDFILESHSSKTSIGKMLFWIFIGFWLAWFAQAISVVIEFYVLKIDVGSKNTDLIVELARMNTLFIIIPAVVGPILEELVFRKVIFGSLYKKVNFFWAALLSSIIFAVMHMDFSHLLIYTTMGFVFAFLYVITKRIIVPIIVHMSLNSFAVIGQLLLDPEEIDRMRQELFLLIFGG